MHSLMRTYVSICCLLMWCIAISEAADNKCKDITTFNFGLISAFPGHDIRRAAAFNAVKHSGDDFVCAQEIWFEEDLSAMIKEVKGVYPYHFSKIHNDVGVLRKTPCMAERRSAKKDTPCTNSEAKRFLPAIQKCAVEKGCTSLPTVQQGVCIILQCADIMRSGLASETCISCLILHTPKPMSESFPLCLTPKAVHNRLNNPGLVILSKTPITGVSYRKYFPNNKMSIERGFIQARLDDGKIVACTHLASLFDIYPEYDLPFGSYQEQHKAEVRVINDTFIDRDHILLGDLNTGPKVENTNDDEKNLVGEFPDNYDNLMSLGYRAPYLDLDGRCTYCRANILTQNYSNNVIDQVLVHSDHYTTPFAIRMYDDITVGNLPLSDHYGVKVQVCDP